MSRPDTDPPFFFRRVWSGGTEMDEVTVLRRLPDGTLRIDMDVPLTDLSAQLREEAGEPESVTANGLVIYGRAIIPPADRAYVEQARSRGLVFSECFSTECVEGEVGTHPVATLTEITRDEFEEARANGWL